jgi:hypothetical protein
MRNTKLYGKQIIVCQAHMCRVIYIHELLTFFLKLERSKATLRNVRILKAIH